MDDSTRAVQHQATVQALRQEVFTLRHMLGAYDALARDHARAAQQHAADLEAQLDDRDALLRDMQAHLGLLSREGPGTSAAPVAPSSHGKPALRAAWQALLRDGATCAAAATVPCTPGVGGVDCAVQTDDTVAASSVSPASLDGQLAATEAELRAVTDELTGVLEAYDALQTQTAADKGALGRVLADATDELNVCHATIAALEQALGTT
eukprot:m.807102 g.807102  ORF g.807102 m.807102 type:complete len:209 (+) comp23377_c0_seq56:3628-4254(+)